MKARYVLGAGGCVCVAVHGWAHCSILCRLADWGCDWQTAATETSAGAPLSHPVIVSPMKGSLITPAQRGLPSSPIPEIHRPPPFPLPPQPPFPSLLHLLSLPYPLPPLLSYPPSPLSCNIQPRGWGGFKDSPSLSPSLSLGKHKHTHTCNVCVRSICQNSFSSVIGLGVPVSMR